MFKVGSVGYSLGLVEHACSRAFTAAFCLFHVSSGITLLNSAQNPNKVSVFLLSVYKPGEKGCLRTSPSVYEHGISLHLFLGPMNF